MSAKDRRSTTEPTPPTIGVYASMQMTPTLLVPEVCDVKIEDELENIMKWSNVNKLQLNLVKSKEIVFRRSNVQLDILPVQLNSTE